jgi:hypothetical protein
MKEVAILLVLVVLLNGCGTNAPTVQSTAGGTWQAQLLGGTGNSSGFSFISQFTVGGAGVLSISSFQFLTQVTNGQVPNTPVCFPVNGGTVSGLMILTVNTNNSVTGPFTFVVQSNGNTLTLTGTVTGTATNGTTLVGSSVTGNWALTGGGTGGCANAAGSFSMLQAS